MHTPIRSPTHTRLTLDPHSTQSTLALAHSTHTSDASRSSSMRKSWRADVGSSPSEPPSTMISSQHSTLYLRTAIALLTPRACAASARQGRDAPLRALQPDVEEGPLARDAGGVDTRSFRRLLGLQIGGGLGRLPDVLHERVEQLGQMRGQPRHRALQQWHVHKRAFRRGEQRRPVPVGVHVPPVVGLSAATRARPGECGEHESERGWSGERYDTLGRVDGVERRQLLAAPGARRTSQNHMRKTETRSGESSSRKWQCLNRSCWSVDATRSRSSHGTEDASSRSTMRYSERQMGQEMESVGEGWRASDWRQYVSRHASCTYLLVPTHSHGAIMRASRRSGSSSRQIQQRCSSPSPEAEDEAGGGAAFAGTGEARDGGIE